MKPITTECDNCGIGLDIDMTRQPINPEIFPDPSMVKVHNGLRDCPNCGNTITLVYDCYDKNQVPF